MRGFFAAIPSGLLDNQAANAGITRNIPYFNIQATEDADTFQAFFDGVFGAMVGNATNCPTLTLIDHGHDHLGGN